MVKKLLFLALLFFIALGFFVAKNYFYPMLGQGVGYLQVTSTPQSTIFIDGKAVSQTPHTRTLNPGKYKIKLIPILESKTDSYAPWEGEVVVSSNNYTVVRRDLDKSPLTSQGEVLTLEKSPINLNSTVGAISVESNPPGSIVSLDGQDIGVAPNVINNVLLGVHEISVFLPKFKRRTVAVNVESGGYITKVKFDLSLDPNYQKKFELSNVFEATLSAKLNQATTPTPTPDANSNTVAEENFTNVLILQTPTGFLRVRDGANLSAAEIAKVKPGEKYKFKSTSNGWVEIELQDGQTGFVSEDYVKKTN